MRFIVGKNDTDWQNTIKTYIMDALKDDVIVVPTVNIAIIVYSALALAGKKDIEVEIGEE